MLVLLGLVGAAVPPVVHTQEPDRTEGVLRDFSEQRKVNKNYKLLLGPLPAGALPAGTEITARLTGQVSKTYALAVSSASKPKLLGTGTATVQAGTQTRLGVELVKEARDGLRSTKKLVGVLRVTARSGESKTTVERNVSVLPRRAPRCFGAASLDARPCRNPLLEKVVIPSPAEALLSPNAACIPIPDAFPYQCLFGVPPDGRAPQVALVGDSHAAHWRGAVEHVADQHGWVGVSMTRAGCALSARNKTGLNPTERKECRRWNRAVTEWFQTHPTVHTVFVSANSTGLIVMPRGGTDRRAEARKGYITAWSALPATVKRIVVIRDVPQNVASTADCVERAMRKGQRAGAVCAVPRRKAIEVRDNQADAARSLRSPRVRVLDLTRYFCGQSICYPVVGGALVHKDEHHITDVYSTTLGPFLNRRFNRLEPVS